MPREQGLHVRRHLRHSIDLSAVMRLSEETAGSVKLTPASGGLDRLPVRLTNVGDGGLQVASEWFLPKGSVVEVLVLGEDGSVTRPILQAKCQVRRVVMEGRTPTYAIGMSFTEPNPRLTQEVADILAAVPDSGAGPAGEASTGQDDGVAA